LSFAARFFGRFVINRKSKVCHKNSLCAHNLCVIPILCNLWEKLRLRYVQTTR
jgi:hypothetical protein